MRKFDLSLRSSRSSYFATFRHQLTILSKTDALDEEKWLNMLGTFVKDWFRYESHFVHGRDSLVDKLAAERPLKDIRDEYNYPKKKGIKDECSRLLEASTMKSRRGFAIQRLMNAMRQAHADGWFIVFDTLTLADDRLEAFYDNPNALRDYFR